MPLIGSQNLLDLPTYNGKVPNDGPRTIPVPVDFSVESVWTLDLTLQTKLKIVGFLQSVFVDNKDSDAPLYIRTNTIRQTICIPGRSQAYVPLLLSDSPTVELESASGAPMLLHFLNVPMPLHVWSTVTQPALLVDANGYLQVNVPALDAIISDPDGSGNGLGVHVLSGGGGGGSGLRLPADYGAFRGSFQSGITANLIIAAPRFYVNSLVMTLDAGAYRSVGTDGAFTVTVYQGGSDKWATTVWLPGTAPAPGATTVAPLTLFELYNLDWWSTVDAENLRIGLSASLGGAPALRVCVTGGTGSPP